MKVLFVSKRRPQQRDLIERPYGRFFHLPVQLAAMGHEVLVMLCDHQRSECLVVRAHGVTWSTHDIRLKGARAFLHELKQGVAAFNPDWIVGLSDAQFGWLAHYLAKAANARLAIDAYDNYEAYMPWNIPLHAMWRRSLKAADLVTAAGPHLAELLASHAKTSVHILPMAADPEFQPMDRLACRQTLNLPAEQPLIGYIGSWAKNRGTDILLEAFRHVRRMRPDALLILSGRPPERATREPGVLAIGYVADERLPAIINALDVACVITAQTRFGLFSYPAKLCEAMACGTPVVATATPPVRWMLSNNEAHLTPIADASALAKRMLGQLSTSRSEYSYKHNWAEVASTMNDLLRSNS